MLRISLAALIAAIGADAAAANLDKGRKLYAIGEATEAYCPGISFGYVAKSAIMKEFDYRPPGTNAEMDALEVEKQTLLRAYRNSGNRTAVCEYVMQQYGPGAPIELLEFD